MKSNIKRAVCEKTIVATVVGLLGTVTFTSALAASATATATATVLTPMTISATTNMNFGDLVGGNGTVTLATDGTLSKTGTTPIPTVNGNGNPVSAAMFTIGGTGTSTFAITAPSTVTLTGTGNSSNTMTLTPFWEVTATSTGTGATSGTPATGALTAGAAYIFVGGSLPVGASQAADTYVGNIQVSVDYN